MATSAPTRARARSLPYPLPPLGTALIGAAAGIGVLLSLLFAVVTLPILALLRLAAPRRAAARNPTKTRKTRRPSC